jgi:hypothetical protein
LIELPIGLSVDGLRISADDGNGRVAGPQRDEGRQMNDLKRPWNGFWSWRDKPVGERGVAQQLLNAAGFKVERLVSREAGQDPPDCEGLLDDIWSGIEVTELVHEPTLKQSLKATQHRAAGTVPERPEVYFNWERDDLLAALDQLLKRKDKKPNGSSFDRYVLMVHTNEMYLDRERVGHFLKDATFRTNIITDAFLGLSYDPSCKDYPIFRLNLAAGPVP